MPLDDQTEAAATRATPVLFEDLAGAFNNPYNPGQASEKPTGVRELVRLFQCRICSFPLREPVSLPCGRTICRHCLPETHRRINITYPAGPGRLRGFQCPFIQCGKEHALEDCSTDVLLNKAAIYIKTEIDRERANASNWDEIVIHITSQDAWGVAGIASLRGPERRSKTIKGGKLVSTYMLAEEGELQYEDEVSYEDASTKESRFPNAFDDIVVLKRAQEHIHPEMECQVCYAIFYDPLTTACGHTFCRSCLHRILDHSRHCPICRRQLNMNPLLNRASCPSNDTLIQIIETFWLDEILARKAALEAERLHLLGEFDVPLFVCTLSFPYMPTFLHIFEPRYRLMLRRVMEGNRIFGMVLPKRPEGPSDAHFHEYGTLLRVVNAQSYPDGRSLIETVGLSRFRVIRHGMLDGYTVGKTERVDDICLEEEEALEAAEAMPEPESTTPEGEGGIDVFAEPVPRPPPHVSKTLADLETMSTQSLMEYAMSFVERMRSRSAPWLTQRMLSLYGDYPEDPAIFPWWFGSMLPVRDLEKYRLLGTSSVRHRLKICCSWIIEWETSRW